MIENERQLPLKHLRIAADMEGPAAELAQIVHRGDPPPRRFVLRLVLFGETAYVDLQRSELITRHFVWRQAQHGSVGPHTRSFFLVSEIIQPFADRADTVRQELVETCEHLFSIKTQSVILTADTPGWYWTEEQ